MPSDKNAQIALVQNLIPDNTQRLVSPARIRQALLEIISSSVCMEELTEQYINGAIRNILLRDALDPKPDPAHTEGLIFWDDTEKALSYYNEESDTKINTGQEIVTKVINNELTDILNGEVVRFDTAVSGNPAVVRSIADSIEHASVSGIATHDIPAGGTGYITRIGKVSSLNTSGFTEGAVLYVSATVPGQLTEIAPAITTPAAVVLVSDLNNGVIYTGASRALDPIAIGQLREFAPVSQAITSTPTPAIGYGATPFNRNTNIQSIVSGTGHRGTFAILNQEFEGYYEFTGTAAIQSPDNEVIVLEVYKNQQPTGLLSVISLTNPSTDTGSAAISAFDPIQTINTDEYEVYVYTQGGPATINYLSFGVSMKRWGAE